MAEDDVGASAERPRPPRRSPTVGQLRIWRAFTETASAVQAELGARLQRESDLSAGDYAVLLALSEASGRALRSSELADTIGWERSRLSHHLGRMERRGLVTREVSEGDQRGAVVTATDDSLRAFRRASAAHLRAVREVFVDALTPAELDAAGDVAQALRRGIDERRRASVAPPPAETAG